jgi:hypothetical protein
MSSSRKWRIEIKVDFDDENKHPVFENAVKREAKVLLATAMLLKDRRDPQLVVTNGSVFIPQSEIEMAGDEEEELADYA